MRASNLAIVMIAATACGGEGPQLQPEPASAPTLSLDVAARLPDEHCPTTHATLTVRADGGAPLTRALETSGGGVVAHIDDVPRGAHLELEVRVGPTERPFYEGAAQLRPGDAQTAAVALELRAVDTTCGIAPPVEDASDPRDDAAYLRRLPGGSVEATMYREELLVAGEDGYLVGIEPESGLITLSLWLGSHPTSLALDEPNEVAAIGHQGGVFLVDLATLGVRDVPLDFDVRRVAIRDGLAFATGPLDLDIPMQIIDVATGAVTWGGQHEQPRIMFVEWLRPDAAGQHLYCAAGDGIIRVPVASRLTQDDVLFRDDNLGDPGRFWASRLFMSRDSHTLYLNDGFTFDLRAGGEDDVSYRRRFEHEYFIASLDDHVESGRIVALMRAGSAYSMVTSLQDEQHVRIYRRDTLAREASVRVPRFVDDAGPRAAFGQSVFLRADGRRAFIVATTRDDRPAAAGVAVLELSEEGGPMRWMRRAAR